MAYVPELPRGAELLGHERIAAQWFCETEHTHTIECLWIWHWCTQILGPDAEAPGEEFGWRPSGVRLHDLVSIDPLELSPSLLFTGCCEMHGWVQRGVWVSA